MFRSKSGDKITCSTFASLCLWVSVSGWLPGWRFVCLASWHLISSSWSCWANYNNFARPAIALRRTSTSGKGNAIIKRAIALWAFSRGRALRSPLRSPFLNYALRSSYTQAEDQRNCPIRNETLKMFHFFKTSRVSARAAMDFL